MKRREAQIVAAGGARYRWVVRARPDYEPPTELYDAIRGDVAHDLGDARHVLREPIVPCGARKGRASAPRPRRPRRRSAR